MDPELITTIVGILTTGGGALLGYGKLKQKVDNLEKNSSDQEQRMQTQIEEVKKDLKEDLDQHKTLDSAEHAKLEDELNRFELRIEAKIDKIIDFLMNINTDKK